MGRRLVDGCTSFFGLGCSAHLALTSRGGCCRGIWSGPLLLPIMYLMLDPWTCIFTDRPGQVSKLCARSRQLLTASRAVPLVWTCRWYAVLLPPHQADGAHYSTSDCNWTLQCYTPRHSAALAFAMIATALIYFSLVLPDRRPLSSVRVFAPPPPPPHLFLSLSCASVLHVDEERTTSGLSVTCAY